jgi:hypothetical protein
MQWRSAFEFMVYPNMQYHQRTHPHMPHAMPHATCTYTHKARADINQIWITIEYGMISVIRCPHTQHTADSHEFAMHINQKLHICKVEEIVRNKSP